MFKIDMHDEAVCFGRLVSRDAGQELAPQPQRGSAVCSVVDDTGHEKA
jgi:hypothetical protein